MSRTVPDVQLGAAISSSQRGVSGPETTSEDAGPPQEGKLLPTTPRGIHSQNVHIRPVIASHVESK